MNDIQLLSEVGQALYGENWQIYAVSRYCGFRPKHAPMG